MQVTLWLLLLLCLLLLLGLFLGFILLFGIPLSRRSIISVIFHCFWHFIIIESWRRSLWFVVLCRCQFFGSFRGIRRLSSFGLGRGCWWWCICQAYLVRFSSILLNLLHLLKLIVALVHWNRCHQIWDSFWLLFFLLQYGSGGWLSLLFLFWKGEVFDFILWWFIVSVEVARIYLDLVLHENLAFVAESTRPTGLIPTENIGVLAAINFAATVSHVEVYLRLWLFVSKLLILYLVSDWGLSRVTSVISVCNLTIYHGSSCDWALSTRNIRKTLSMILRCIHAVNYFSK